MSAREYKMNCSEAAPLLVFLACDEVTSEEREALVKLARMIDLIEEKSGIMRH